MSTPSLPPTPALSPDDAASLFDALSHAIGQGKPWIMPKPRGVRIEFYDGAYNHCAYPPESPLEELICTGLFLKALTALGYDVSPHFHAHGTASEDGPVWFLDLHGYRIDQTWGPDLLPLLANALIAATLSVKDEAPQ